MLISPGWQAEVAQGHQLRLQGLRQGAGVPVAEEAGLLNRQQLGLQRETCERLWMEQVS